MNPFSHQYQKSIHAPQALVKTALFRALDFNIGNFKQLDEDTFMVELTSGPLFKFKSAQIKFSSFGEFTRLNFVNEIKIGFILRNLTNEKMLKELFDKYMEQFADKINDYSLVLKTRLEKESEQSKLMEKPHAGPQLA